MALPHARTAPDQPRPVEVVAYFGDDPLRAYQLRQWLPVLERLDEVHRVLLVLRDPATAGALAPQTRLPYVLVPTFGELTELYRTVEAKVAVYVNNSAKNFQSLVARSMVHVHVNHGESDKICMVSNQVKAYDRVFVAGDAAVARHRAALIGFDTDRLVPVGRPQLDLVPPTTLARSDRRTVLYAPTWEGEEPSNCYTSVDVMGPRLVAEALRLDDVRVVYKPHPRVVTSTTPLMATAHREVLDLLDAANSVDPGAGHAYLPDADILSVFGACDLMVTDVSSVGLDFLYLHVDKPLVIADRFADPVRLREAAPISRCADVVVPAATDGLARLLAARLRHDVHAGARRRMRRHYFGDRAVGESTETFVARIGEMVALRDLQVRRRAESPDAAAAAALGAPGSFGDPMLDETWTSSATVVPHPAGPAGPADQDPSVGDLAVVAAMPSGPDGEHGGRFDRYDRAEPAVVQAVVLASGAGERGGTAPAALTPLADGRTVLSHQLDALDGVFGASLRSTVVVGLRADLVMPEAADGRAVSFVLDPAHERSGSAKALLVALRASGPGGVLWVDGDVVLDPCVLERVAPLVAEDRSFVCVDDEDGRDADSDARLSSGVDDYGFVTVLSKSVTEGLRLLGLNYIASQDKATFVEHLEGCADTDRLERGIGAAVEAGLKVRPVDISEFFSVDADFTTALDGVNQEVSRTVTSAA